MNETLVEATMLGIATISSAILLVRVGSLRYPARHRLRPGVEWQGRARGATRPVVRLVLHLWPVGLLTLIYPIASQRMAGTTVGGAELTSLLLAASLTVPWLSQGVCMPFYRAVGPLVPAGDIDAIRRRFCEVWPVTFAQSLPTILLFAVPAQLATGWSMTTMGAYVALCILDLAFAQSLVLTNLGRERFAWALAWTGYAAPLLVFPTLWFLPPLLGLLPQLLTLRRFLPFHPDRRDHVEVIRDVAGGLLLGSVLWADKLCYLLVAGALFPVETVFLALLPAILAYNYYFICLAPKLDSSVSSLRAAMEREPLDRLGSYSEELSARVETSVARTAVVGAGLVFTISWAMISFRSESGALVVAVAVASWMFMLITILTYKLDYIGQRRSAQGWSALHLLLCVAVFVGLPAGPAAYFTLAAIEAIMLIGLLRACLHVWRAPAYTFFWRHATAW